MANSSSLEPPHPVLRDTGGKGSVRVGHKATRCRRAPQHHVDPVAGWQHRASRLVVLGSRKNRRRGEAGPKSSSDTSFSRPIFQSSNPPGQTRKRAQSQASKGLGGRCCQEFGVGGTGRGHPGGRSLPCSPVEAWALSPSSFTRIKEPVGEGGSEEARSIVIRNLEKRRVSLSKSGSSLLIHEPDTPAVAVESGLEDQGFLGPGQASQ